jgi:uncharacterized membrane protein
MLLFCFGKASAQVDCVYSILHLSRLQGVLYDPTGEIISGAVVKLKQDKQIVFEFKTDENGRFSAKVAPGKYELLIEARGFEPVESRIEIGTNLRTIFQAKTLRVIALVSIWDSCETLTTSKREFEKAVRANNQRLKETEQNHATQK